MFEVLDETQAGEQANPRPLHGNRRREPTENASDRVVKPSLRNSLSLSLSVVAYLCYGKLCAC